MGILGNIFKGQFIDIVEWTDDAPNVLVHRFERHNNEIKTNAKLIVRPGQRAIFVNEGKVADQFGPGTYSLSTGNLPILTTLLSLPYGFESWHKAEVYFIRTTIQLNRRWGTPNPVTMRDAEFGMLRLRAFGNYSYKVGETDDMLERFLGGRGEFTSDEIEGQFATFVISQLSDALGEMRIPALDLPSQYNELGAEVLKRLKVEMAGLGFDLQTFTIGNISLPDNVNEAIDKRSAVGALGSVMGQYSQMQAADAMKAAAENPGNGGSMMGMMMGANMAGMVGQNVNQSMAAPPPPPPAAPTFYVAKNGQRLGPFTAEDLQKQAMNGTFDGETQVWTNGMSSWAKASQVPALASVLATVPPPLP